MIRSSFSFKLAKTKFHTKPVVLLSSVLVCSILFSMLFLLSILYTGVESSTSKIINKIYNEKYLVKVYPNIPENASLTSNSLSIEEVRRIKSFEKEYYSNLQKKYESLGITYNKTTEISALTPAAFLSSSLPEEQRVIINWSSPVTTLYSQHLFEEYAKTANNKFSDLKLIGSKYDADGYYLTDKPFGLSNIPTLRIIKDNKEDFSDSALKTGDSTAHGYYINAIHNGSYSFTDQNILNRYIFKNNASELKGIPVIPSAQEAASIFGADLGISEEPTELANKKIWLKDLENKLKNKTYQVCYRNSVEIAMLEKIQRDYSDITNNASTPGYVKPSIIYDYPKNACGDIITKIDTRSDAEKAVDAKSKSDSLKLGNTEEPFHKLINFQIVGLKYSQPYIDNYKNIDGFIKSLMTYQDSESSTIDIPIQLYDNLTESLKIDQISDNSIQLPQLFTEDFSTRIIVFNDVNKARNFLTNETCDTLSSSCNKRFKASPYGSNYLIIDELGNIFNQIASFIYPIILVLAIFILWITIGRIMTENRKEIAVFRAMGASKTDINKIYTTYIFLIATMILIISIIIGIAIAYIINYLYGRILDDNVSLLLGIFNDNTGFNLVGFDINFILINSLLIFIVCILASLYPITRSTARSIINDIRQE